MNPAEKYMTNNKSRADNMNFVPFNGNNPANTTISSWNNMLIAGWIPVFLFNNNLNIATPLNNIMGNLPNNLMGNLSNNVMGNLPNNIMGNLPNNLENNPANQNINNNLSNNNYPDQTMNTTLFSYNKPTSVSVSAKRNNEVPSLVNNDITLLQALREFDLDLDEDVDLVRNSSENMSDNADIEKIFKTIEESNPGTFSLLQAYTVPYPVVKLLIRRVIKLTLNYSSKEVE